MEADCLEIFDTASTLIATLGHPVFMPLNSSAGTKEEQEVFFCIGSDADGRGLYTQEGFVVLKGSSGRVENVPSLGVHMEKFREKLVSSDTIQEQDGRIVFQKDHLFKTPSTAASALMGRSANGWTAWKNKSGQTLDELKRQGGDS